MKRISEVIELEDLKKGEERRERGEEMSRQIKAKINSDRAGKVDNLKIKTLKRKFKSMKRMINGKFSSDQARKMQTLLINKEITK